MKQYNLLPIDWDYESQNAEQHIRYYQANGMFIPSSISRVTQMCGALFGNKKSAIAQAQNLKKDYPFIQFGLYEGDTWGELKLIQQF